ncbi:hypothetical protein [Desulfitobacterium sp. AusDCA]|uniref:hypothetical protein n=1 Tax=Desulfitobacterium sp. AusDCA TaxID=3240383 RepID=UPI003DA757FC
MDKRDIKRVIGRLEPDERMEYRLAEKLNKGVPGRASYRAAASIAAGLVVIIGTGAFMYSHLAVGAKLSMPSQQVSKESTIAQVPDKLIGKSEPEIQGSAGVINVHPTNINQETNISQGKEENAAGSANGPVEDSGPLPSQSTVKENSGTINPNTGSEIPKAAQPQSDKNPDTKPMFENARTDRSEALLSQDPNEQNTGISIPKVQLPSATEPGAKMMGLIVYQGRIYVQSSSSQVLNNPAQLVGEKLGTTKGNLTEWSTQSDYAVELASTIEVQDVYAVKGYDKSFRIMTYGKLNGQTYADFFECLNGITVKSGNDVFDKFKIENNIDSIKYEDFASWDSGKDNYKTLTGLDQFTGFLAALENSVPLEQESLSNLLAQKDLTSQKFLQIKLNDGTKVNLRLFKDGYVYYNGVNIVFKVEDSAFTGLWNELN